MKIRNGFVSNSSSSSFIIGWGVIKDMNSFTTYCKDENITLDFYNAYLVSDEIKKNRHWYDICGGNNTEISIPEKYYDAENIVIVDVGNNEGDGGGSPFCKNGEVGYEKADNLDFFPDNQQKLAKMLMNKKLFIDSHVQWGAERNG